MVPRAWRRRVLGTLLLPAVLWSAVPTVRWCALRWDEICPQLLLGCFAPVEAPLACDAAPSGCEAETCPLAASACPLSVEAAGDDARAEAQTPPDACGDADVPAPVSHGRAFCLGDPTGGLGLRSPTPTLERHVTPTLLAPAIVSAEPAVGSTRYRDAEPRARPPTRVWAALPPTRAPPDRA